MKKILSTMLVAIMLTSAVAGCSSKTNGEASSSSAPVKLPTLAEVHTAVKTAYGENYLPSMAIEEQQLKEFVGINMDNVEEFIGETPMISMHPDTFIAIKAKAGKGADVKADLDIYKDKLINDTLQYPANLAKVQTTEVIQHGDYVFLVMLGAINDNMDATEEDQAKFAKEQAQIGKDAIDKMFK